MSLLDIDHQGYRINEATDGRYYIDSKVFKPSGYASLGAAKSAITRQTSHVANAVKQSRAASEVLAEHGIDVLALDDAKRDVSVAAQGDIGVPKSHDYDPEWDYECEVPTPADRTILIQCTNEACRRLLPALNICSLSVYCVAEGALGHNTLGKFISGTSSAPVVVVDLATIRKASKQHGLNWVDQLRATIAHELAHAFEEANGYEAGNEEATENFARAFVTFGVVNVKTLREELAR
jgi:hypothetical protein